MLAAGAWLVGTDFRRVVVCGLFDKGVSYGPSLDKLSSRIFVTLRYRDEDPIVEKPGAVINANYASVTIISHKSKMCTYSKTLTLSIRIH